MSTYTRYTRLLPSLVAAVLLPACATQSLTAAPKAVLISLDGVTPRVVDAYLQDGTLSPTTGIGRIRNQGLSSLQSFVISPSLTAASHISIATGSTAARNDIPANTFHLVASPLANSISGFGAPIGGYSLSPLGVTGSPTAVPLWINLRAAGKTVVAATFPGADGAVVNAPGITPNTLLQPVAERIVDVTVPFGASTSPFQTGFNLTATDFTAAPQTTIDQLVAVGRPSFSPVLQRSLETFTTGSVSYDIRAAVYDSTNDSVTNYDSVVIFNQAQGITAGPFALPSTGPAYIKPATKISALFYFEGHANKAGVRYFVSNLAADLSTVRIARSSTPFIPRNAAVLADVDDINNNVGFWQPQPDFRIVQRGDATPSRFAAFPDTELEAIYMDLAQEFTTYQANVVIRSMQRLPNADLVMSYFEQPDGSFHQFLLTDARQSTSFNTVAIGANQDAARIARYAQYRRQAYQIVSAAVERVIQAAGGVDAQGRPVANFFLVSDHGFAPFHTSVNMNQLMTNAGFVNTQVRAYNSGPATNIYINLQGRESGGTVTPAQYRTLQQQVITALQNAVDTNPTYNGGTASRPIFDKVYARPLPASDADASFGRGTSEFIGQDSGDIYAILNIGYNFDGIQSPVVIRTGDATVAVPVLSQAGFYGAHGYSPEYPEMSSIFYAAGPAIAPGTFSSTRNIDIAPTLMSLLGVAPSPLVEGRALPLGLGGAITMSGNIAIKRGGLTLQRPSMRFVQTLTLTNTGASALTGPLYVAVDNLSANATVFGATGTTANNAPLGSSYVTVALPGNTLAAGATVSVNLTFTNPTRAAISYTPRLLGPTAP